MVTLGIDIELDTELTKDWKTDSRIEESSETDLQDDAVCSRYKLSCNSPTPIVFQQVRSCIKHKFDRKNKATWKCFG